MARRSRAALTLVELLVVIAIVGILASLLLPAILQSRSAGRRSQCAANLKQLAQATQSFHDRQNCLPAYWGAMKGGGGEVFGGWLLHLLPDLDQQAAYDMVAPRGTLSIAPNTSTVTTSTSWIDNVQQVATGRMLPGRPASADYQPERTTTGTAFDSANNAYVYPVVVPQVGDPGEPAQPEYVTVVVGPPVQVVTTSTNVSSNWGGLSDEHDSVTRNIALPVLLDPEDGSPMRSPRRPGVAPTGYEDAPLANYQANAHVLTKFNGARYILNAAETSITFGAFGPVAFSSPSAATKEFAGYFPPPLQAGPGGTIMPTTVWNHQMSGTSGPVAGRRFDHITDGISNTLLFAEGMRQCDAEKGYRHAFLPSGPGGANVSPTWFHEHAFGILPSLRQVTTFGGAVISGTARAPVETFGNTLMFQTQPLPVDCNPTRLQALHGNFLMTALCDGSVRAISSLVSRREPVGAAACGRARFGTNRGDFQSRGGQLPRTDGIWDMLMVPADPPENVLSNTGEIGRERGPNDPPL